MKKSSDWQVYRTRFLIKARQLTEPLVFIDPLGREHRGAKGDYLVESSDGSKRIAPREIFEDVYVAMIAQKASFHRGHIPASDSRTTPPASKGYFA